MIEAVRVILHLWTSISSEKPDAVHFNCCISSVGIWRDLVMVVLTRLRGLPVVVHYHGSLPDVLAREPAITLWGLRILARSASINIGITRDSVALLDRVTGGKAVFIANFIEDEMVDAPRPQAMRPRPASHLRRRLFCR